jgi:hypothetical protein
MPNTRATRRQFLHTAAANLTAAAFPTPLIAQGAGAPVVVIGGG